MFFHFCFIFIVDNCNYNSPLNCRKMLVVMLSFNSLTLLSKL